jgi:transcriptional regulator with XRE-family HTH domain
MAKRKSKPRKSSAIRFRSGEEIRALALALRKRMGEPYVHLTGEAARNFEDLVRLAPFAERFKAEREAEGLSIKDVSDRIKAPQYRLEEIERASPDIKQEHLEKYANFLELGSWVRSWAKANRELAERLGISDRPPTRRDTLANRRRHVHRFKIQLKEIQPPIWRRIEVPSTYSFWDLHVAIQDAMGWLDCHLHLFSIKEPKSGELHEIGFPDKEAIAEMDVLHQVPN